MPPSPPAEKANVRHSIGKLLDTAITVAPAELAFHSISRFARASNDGGTSSPSAFAVLRLITNRHQDSRDLPVPRGHGGWWNS